MILLQNLLRYHSSWASSPPNISERFAQDTSRHIETPMSDSNCKATVMTLLYSIILYYTLLYSIILYYTLLYSIILYYTLLYSIILYYTLLHSIILYYTLLYSIILYYTLLYSIILYYTLLYSIILYYTLLYSIILYYTLLYSIILYYTLLYSIILYYTLFNVHTGPSGPMAQWQHHRPRGLSALMPRWAEIGRDRWNAWGPRHVLGPNMQTRAEPGERAIQEIQDAYILFPCICF